MDIKAYTEQAICELAADLVRWPTLAKAEAFIGLVVEAWARNVIDTTTYEGYETIYAETASHLAAKAAFMKAAA